MTTELRIGAGEPFADLNAAMGSLHYNLKGKGRHVLRVVSDILIDSFRPDVSTDETGYFHIQTDPGVKIQTNGALILGQSGRSHNSIEARIEVGKFFNDGKVIVQVSNNCKISDSFVINYPGIEATAVYAHPGGGSTDNTSSEAHRVYAVGFNFESRYGINLSDGGIINECTVEDAYYGFRGGLIKNSVATRCLHSCFHPDSIDIRHCAADDNTAGDQHSLNMIDPLAAFLEPRSPTLSGDSILIGKGDLGSNNIGYDQVTAQADRTIDDYELDDVSQVPIGGWVEIGTVTASGTDDNISILIDPGPGVEYETSLNGETWSIRENKSSYLNVGVTDPLIRVWAKSPEEKETTETRSISIGGVQRSSLVTSASLIAGEPLNGTVSLQPPSINENQVAFAVGNTLWVQHKNLRGMKSNATVETAEVTAKIVDAAGDVVPGEDWPVTLSHVGEGNYEAFISGSLEIVPFKQYSLHVEAKTDTGSRSLIVESGRAQYRDKNSFKG